MDYDSGTAPRRGDVEQAIRNITAEAVMVGWTDELIERFLAQVFIGPGEIRGTPSGTIRWCREYQFSYRVWANCMFAHVNSIAMPTSTRRLMDISSVRKILTGRSHA